MAILSGISTLKEGPLLLLVETILPSIRFACLVILLDTWWLLMWIEVVLLYICIQIRSTIGYRGRGALCLFAGDFSFSFGWSRKMVALLNSIEGNIISSWAMKEIFQSWSTVIFNTVIVCCVFTRSAKTNNAHLFAITLLLFFSFFFLYNPDSKLRPTNYGSKWPFPSSLAI